MTKNVRKMIALTNKSSYERMKMQYQGDAEMQKQLDKLIELQNSIIKEIEESEQANG